MTWNRRGRTPPAAPFLGQGMVVGERQRQLYVSPATQHVNLCQTGGIRQAALPLGRNVVRDLRIF